MFRQRYFLATLFGYGSHSQMRTLTSHGHASLVLCVHEEDSPRVRHASPGFTRDGGICTRIITSTNRKLCILTFLNINA